MIGEWGVELSLESVLVDPRAGALIAQLSLANKRGRPIHFGRDAMGHFRFATPQGEIIAQRFGNLNHCNLHQDPNCVRMSFLATPTPPGGRRPFTAEAFGEAMTGLAQGDPIGLAGTLLIREGNAIQRLVFTFDPVAAGI